MIGCTEGGLLEADAGGGESQACAQGVSAGPLSVHSCRPFGILNCIEIENNTSKLLY